MNLSERTIPWYTRAACFCFTSVINSTNSNYVTPKVLKGHNLDRKKPPRPGGWLCGLQPRTGGKGPQLDQLWGWFFRGGPLPPGSWSGNIVNRNPPRGGGFLSIKLKNNPQNWSILELWEQPPKLINFWGCSYLGVLFLRVLGLETTQQRNPPREGGFFRSILTRSAWKDTRTYGALPIPVEGRHSNGVLCFMEVRETCLLEIVSPGCRAEQEKMVSRFKQLKGKHFDIQSPVTGKGGGNCHIWLSLLTLTRRIMMVTKYNVLERCCISGPSSLIMFIFITNTYTLYVF